MSETVHDTFDDWVKQALGFDIVARRQQVRDEVQPEGRQRSSSFTYGQGDRTPPRREPPPRPQTPPDPSLPFRTELAKVQDTLNQAANVQGQGKIITGLRQEYTDSMRLMTQAQNGQDWPNALAALQKAAVAARRLLLAQQVRDSAPQKQLQDQTGLYDEIAPVLGEVQRTYFNPLAGSGSARLKKESLNAGDHFKAYLKALAVVETGKQKAGNPPSPQQVGELKTAAQALIDAAQAHLDHFERDLSKSDKKDKKALRKKQICEEGLKMARHYLMALELQEIGEPTQQKPWSQEQQVKVNQLRAQVNFETGYKKASGLGGESGQSSSFWVESQELGSQKGKKHFIFKPMDGERSTLNDEPGAGATKESLASAQSKLFLQQTGIDLGVPETSVATIGSYAIDDPDAPSQTRTGSIQQFEETDGAFEGQKPDILDRIDPKECQRMALNDILSLNLDRHAGNFLVQNGKGPNGSPRLVPIDNGITRPSPEELSSSLGDFGGLMNMSPIPKNVMLSMPGAFEKFSPDMQDAIALLDPDAMIAGLKEHRTALDNVNPGLGAKDKVPDKTLDVSKRVMQFLKKAAPFLSPAEIQIAITQNAAIFADANQDIEQIADQIIQEAAPKGPGYAEFLNYPLTKREDIAKKLVANGWAKFADVQKFIMKDPVVALKLFKANVAKGQDDAATEAGRVDMRSALTGNAKTLLQDSNALLPDVDPGDQGNLTQRYSQLDQVDPKDEQAAKDLEDKARKLLGDATTSCLSVLMAEGKRIYDTYKSRMPEMAARNFEMQYTKGLCPACSTNRDVKGARECIRNLQQLTQMAV